MRQSAITTFVLTLLAAGSAAPAQVTAHEELTLDGARQVIAAALAEAKKDVGTGVIAVVDRGGNLMAVERLDGTFAAGANIAIGKARTAALFARPTRGFEEIIGNGRTAMVALDDFTPLQGGVPIVHDGEVVGGVGVSGAASAQRDEEIAVAGAAALAAGASATAGSVEFIDHQTVRQASAKGSPLIETGAYKVHASRREGPGQAEVHERDTDIIYALSGGATLITGGELVDAKTVAPEEIRGSAIAGGQRRRLVPGDVLIVPHGVPHWFEQVEAPFTYYVVKVP